MTAPSFLAPLPVAIPLLAAAALAIAGKRTPRALADVVAIGATLATLALDAALFLGSRGGTIVHWFGGWTPRAGGIVVGICFAVDPIGAGVATLSALLVLAALVYALRYFDAIGSLFHVLLLAFLAALGGFSLTGDLFDLFVFFELMSASAYALCGYKSEEPAVDQGAFNFAVVNTAGAFLALFGIALLYGRTGALNMAQIGATLGARPDALAAIALALLACGFLVKAAAAPFHFWLADAHAVAPTPICILFSGVMVEAGLYAVARIWTAMLSAPLAAAAPRLTTIFLAMAVATAMIGAAMCFAQRHLKRLLAFSTIAHVGVMLGGVALLDAGGIAGASIYVVGHGLVKAALFLLAGVVLHRWRDVDEIRLLGRGRGAAIEAALFALGGLALAGLPPFGTFLGEAALDDALEARGLVWVGWIFTICVAVTAAAVLRATGRIFFGFGPPREEIAGVGGETSEQPETPAPRERRTPATMLLVPAALLALALVAGLAPWRAAAHAQAERMLDRAGYAATVLVDLPATVPAATAQPSLTKAIARGLFATLLALLLAGATLFRDRLLSPRARQRGGRIVDAAWRPLRLLHSGHVGDYVAWLTAGVAAVGGAAVLLAR